MWEDEDWNEKRENEKHVHNFALKCIAYSSDSIYAFDQYWSFCCQAVNHTVGSL